jgi:catechol 2,3-dioxygenase-like lactoylglutathione lyase family enzyme
MTVRRIVANLPARNPAGLAAFYRELLDLDLLMDLGFIVTVGPGAEMTVQMSVASEGGSGTPLPVVSIEVDDVDAVLAKARKMDVTIAYGPVDEPWGVRRFFISDPEGSLVNILSHS